MKVIQLSSSEVSNYRDVLEIKSPSSDNHPNESSVSVPDSNQMISELIILNLRS